MAGSQLKQIQWNTHSSQYLGEISALCFLHLPSHISSFSYLLAGTVSQVLLYDLESSKMIKYFQVFEGIRVHGLICSLLDDILNQDHCLAIGCSDNSVHLWDMTNTGIKMEFNRKGREFIKGKLTPLYRAVKPAATMQYTTKVKPNQSSTTTASVGFRVHQDYMVSQPRQISYIVPADKNREKLSQIDNFFGIIGDENVDSKAATYISSVQERFKLEKHL